MVFFPVKQGLDVHCEAVIVDFDLVLAAIKNSLVLQDFLRHLRMECMSLAAAVLYVEF
jgi:hypothetical protein